MDAPAAHVIEEARLRLEEAAGGPARLQIILILTAALPSRRGSAEKRDKAGAVHNSSARLGPRR
jgi:hypothetical protein